MLVRRFRLRLGGLFEFERKLMSLMRTASTAIAISGLLLGSTMAQAADAPARESSSVSDSEGLAGGGFGFVIAGLVALGIILVISDDNGNNAPASP